MVLEQKMANLSIVSGEPPTNIQHLSPKARAGPLPVFIAAMAYILHGNVCHSFRAEPESSKVPQTVHVLVHGTRVRTRRVLRYRYVCTYESRYCNIAASMLQVHVHSGGLSRDHLRSRGAEFSNQKLTYTCTCMRDQRRPVVETPIPPWIRVLQNVSAIVSRNQSHFHIDFFFVFCVWFYSTRA